MDSPSPAIHRSLVVVDPAARGVFDPSTQSIVGIQGPAPRSERLQWSSSLSVTSAVSARYQPPHPPGEVCQFGFDLSAIIPPGQGIISGSLAIFTNAAVPAPVPDDFTIGPVTIRGRRVYALLQGGVAGTDYQLRWSVEDTLGNTWLRTALLLCAGTS